MTKKARIEVRCDAAIGKTDRFRSKRTVAIEDGLPVGAELGDVVGGTTGLDEGAFVGDEVTGFAVGY